MKRKTLIAIAVLSSFVSPFVRPASAHRLDEYLQATILSVDKDQLHASMRLIPGVAVSSAVIANIDTNRDGIFSEREQNAYAQRVLADLSLTIDTTPLKLHLVSADFPQPEEMRAGLGEIHIEFTADLPPINSGSSNRTLTLENHHQNQNSAYLVNSLVPSDPNIQIVTQTRNEQQSLYRLEYIQSAANSTGPPAPWSANLRGAFNASGFPTLFRLGMRHIAEGTDHLLFLLALLLPAPLIARGSRWAGFAGLRPSLRHILTIVTAFTIGHSVTLALAAWGVVSVPSRPIEVLIAVSILISAIHALRPIFPGKEAAIAAFFGLIHGLAFAATLTNLGLGRWERLFGILAFNLGIETMQLIVVALTMPSLVLLSRTRAYPPLRITGALFAALAALGWIDERLFGGHTSVDTIVGSLAHHALAIAVALFLISLSSWLLSRPSRSGDPAAPVGFNTRRNTGVPHLSILRGGHSRSETPSSNPPVNVG